MSKDTQITKRFRNYFFRGMTAVLPTILTIWIFVQCYKFVQGNIGIHINRGVVRLIVLAAEDYLEVTKEQLHSFVISENEQLRNDADALAAAIQDPAIQRGAKIQRLERFWVDGYGAITGFFIALIIVYIVGVVLASVFGKALWRMIENFLMRTPFLRRIYPYIKQITDFLFTKEKLAYLRVVAVEYPRKGIWSVGMVTGSGLKRIIGQAQEEYLTIFVPTSPTPFTGYVIMTTKDQTIDLDMTIEEALRFTVSGGVITPADQLNKNSLPAKLDLESNSGSTKVKD